jgi:putative ABC transport system permease protein
VTLRERLLSLNDAVSNSSANAASTRVRQSASSPDRKTFSITIHNFLFCCKSSFDYRQADIRHRNPQSKPEPCLFLLNTQLPFPLASLVIRTSPDPRALISAIKSAIHEVDPDQGVATIETMEERIAHAGAQSRVQAWLLTAFSVIALALACIGIYGVISYSVSERTREIGVRVSLGADRLRIFGQILRESMALAGAGVALGLLVSFALTRYLETLLFDIKPTDPAVYASVVIVMLIVGAAASYVPSRRAATVDPVVALRDE